jgi:acyl-CoA thioesterase FadM
VAAVSKATLTFVYEARRPDGTVLVDGQTVHAATDLAGRVRRIPEAVRAALGSGGRKAPPQRE